MSLVDNNITDIKSFVKDIKGDKMAGDNNTTVETIENPKKIKKIKEKNRCFNCKKKVGIVGFDCSHCNKYYCSKHRMPEDHSCNIDYKKKRLSSDDIGGGEFKKLDKI